MKAREELAQLQVAGPTLVAVGVFDGVHLGHQHLLGQLKAQAAQRGYASAVVTFKDHPRAVLRPGEPLLYLTLLGERLELLGSLGLDLVVPLTFDHDLAGLRAREFVSLLQQMVGMRGLVVGPDFALGRGREGTIPVLRELGLELGFTVGVVDVLELEEAGPVKSTAVRQAIAEGDVALAGQLLGRPYAIPGRVRRGDGRGRGLGFPTANLEPDPSLALPSNGIYAAWLQAGGRHYPAAASIGVRPTFGPGDRTVEAHLLDFQGDLYGQEVRLAFARRLRDELRFDSAEALVAQMERDVEEARAALEDARVRPPEPLVLP